MALFQFSALRSRSLLYSNSQFGVIAHGYCLTEVKRLRGRGAYQSISLSVLANAPFGLSSCAERLFGVSSKQGFASPLFFSLNAFNKGFPIPLWQVGHYPSTGVIPETEWRAERSDGADRQTSEAKSRGLSGTHYAQPNIN